MQFLVMGYDGTDDKAWERRKNAREEHLKLGNQMKANGELLFAGAILNENEQMAGSIMVCEFLSEKELHQWLEIEPYVVEGVWKKWEIKRFRVGPAFRK